MVRVRVGLGLGEMVSGWGGLGGRRGSGLLYRVCEREVCG